MINDQRLDKINKTVKVIVFKSGKTYYLREDIQRAAAISFEIRTRTNAKLKYMDRITM